ncbi:hypothetical protein Q4Q35_03875 [Flavivirga aquimarina]|uniref:Uncharacterized protein n=1 Tax=Flavivirga aquimarina TaxID=2027862 RepID=A0ABT8W761_9FLAO|nr:hypothetical protein [Flavivirga aquimarina]MDO5968936.1 hypothetical protein [Flavivirga aquimarina]
MIKVLKNFALGLIITSALALVTYIYLNNIKLSIIFLSPLATLVAIFWGNISVFSNDKKEPQGLNKRSVYNKHRDIELVGEKEIEHQRKLPRQGSGAFGDRDRDRDFQDDRYYKSRTIRKDTPKKKEDSSGCTWLIIIFCIIWIVPAIMIYWILNPENVNKAIRISVFIVSLSCSVIYFLLNREKFKSPGDIVGYFSGATIGPVGVTEILFL